MYKQVQNFSNEHKLERTRNHIYLREDVIFPVKELHKSSMQNIGGCNVYLFQIGMK